MSERIAPKAPTTTALTPERRKARAFDRMRDAIAEFGNMPDHIGGILGEIIQTFEHANPHDATLGQLVDGLAYHGCVTGDCPDGHTTSDCARALVAAINEFADDARKLLVKAPTTPREEPHADE